MGKTYKDRKEQSKKLNFPRVPPIQKRSEPFDGDWREVREEEYTESSYLDGEDYSDGWEDDEDYSEDSHGDFWADANYTRSF